MFQLKIILDLAKSRLTVPFSDGEQSFALIFKELRLFSDGEVDFILNGELFGRLT